MVAELTNTQSTLYNTDYVQWVEQTVAHLQSADYDSVDWENLIEEIQDMSKRERRSLESNLIVLLLHLLKWQYQPDCRSGSWKGSIREHRRRINRTLNDSPSLRAYLQQEIWLSSYVEAQSQVADETGLSPTSFPASNPYTIDNTLNPDFLPSSALDDKV
mgnify:CR=1 FL=1